LEAASRIKEHRSNINRPRISDEHWDMIRSRKTLIGHDKESYEYSIHHRQITARLLPESTPSKSEYLLKLEGPLSSVAAVREAAGFDNDPPIFKANDDTGDDATFVVVNGTAKDSISEQLKPFQITFIRNAKAYKNLSPTSAYPTLGIDFTLTQFRPDKPVPVHPQQEEYPVWYFFYGILAEPDRLARLLGLPIEPTFDRAFVTGDAIKTWAGKYRALVDADRQENVYGRAFLVTLAQQEDTLRYYETDNYEVVRCKIYAEMEERQGLTFRFVDNAKLS
ncbi:hypothetical protein NA57DRAFT_47373, partial [Rhizodiscina lignyota]